MVFLYGDLSTRDILHPTPQIIQVLNGGYSCAILAFHKIHCYFPFVGCDTLVEKSFSGSESHIRNDRFNIRVSLSQYMIDPALNQFCNRIGNQLISPFRHFDICDDAIGFIIWEEENRRFNYSS